MNYFINVYYYFILQILQIQAEFEFEKIDSLVFIVSKLGPSKFCPGHFFRNNTKLSFSHGFGSRWRAPLFIGKIKDSSGLHGPCL